MPPPKSTPPPDDPLRQARALARQHGMFVLERTDGPRTVLLLYRQQPAANILIATSRTPENFLRMVKRATRPH